MGDKESAGAAAAAAGEEATTFAELGLEPALVDACKKLGFKKPTPIQCKAIPHALQGRDVIGLAQTGSGKTAAFALPVLQAMLQSGRATPLFAVVLAPTRELAFQISEQFSALGAGIGVRCCVVVGGVPETDQAIALAQKPHVVVATPGRLVYHLENTRGFRLSTLRYLILDEADRLLNLDFETEIEKLLQQVPRERNTLLFSATMTSKVAKLQRASLVSPVKVEVDSKYTTVDTLLQKYIFLPAVRKDCYLVYLLTQLTGNSVIVFAGTVMNAQRITLVLRNLGISAIPLHGQLSQPKRLAALNKFKAGSRDILIATDVASRGLDIPHVDYVLNYDIPQHSKDYIHRVGRTARAGRSGVAVNFVTQYDVELFQRIEQLIGKKLEAYPLDEEAAMLMLERVSEAQRLAKTELASTLPAKRSRRDADADDEDEDGARGSAAAAFRRGGGGKRGRGRGNKRGRR